MKYIKEHIMFMFPLLAILLGIESFLIFDRLSKNYEQDLKKDYSILVISSTDMVLADFQKINMHISSIEQIRKDAIVNDMLSGMGDINTKEIVEELPYFYTVRLNSYLDASAIAKIKRALIKRKNIKSVETFGKNHNSNYNLFIFIKIVLWTFVSLMSFTSLFLVVKQMEIWQYAHRERMQIMEIFGASKMLRSGILLKRAMMDSFISTFSASILFLMFRYIWVPTSGIDLLMQKQDLLFRYSDLLILFVSSLLISMVSVIIVVVGNKESRL